jgi:hypothetical protein
MSHQLPRIAVSILIFGSVLTVLGLALRHERQLKTQPVHAFTLVSKQTFVSNDGKEVLRFVLTRLQRSDGSWKNITEIYNESGSVTGTNEMFGITGRGVFSVNERTHTLVFNSQKDHAFHHLNEDAMRSNVATFLGERTILGFRCLGQRDPEDTETYISPVLAFPLSEVTTTDKGRIVTEAVSVQIGEPSEEQFGRLPDYPVDFSTYERAIEDTERQGEHDLARQMRQIEEQAKQKLAPLH